MRGPLCASERNQYEIGVTRNMSEDVKDHKKSTRDFRDALLATFASGAAKRVVRKTIRWLQTLDSTILSEHVDNMWDEICVQQQGSEHPDLWDEFLNIVRQGLEEDVKKLDWNVQQALWLKTDSGFDWAWDNYGDRAEVPVGSDEIVECLLHQVLEEAGSYTNRAIRRFHGEEE
jgi:hypothetical protein